jgi:glutathione peroxidase-family protein
MIVAANALTGIDSREQLRAAQASSDYPEFAPITERNLDFYDFTLKTPEGQYFNLREFTKGKRLVVVAFIAGWCKNSNENGHVVKRLYDKYKGRGLGVVVVTEYSDQEEIRTHVNRIGIDYPVVSETSSRSERKKSVHYKYRKAVGDNRKWGTPFYVLIETRDIDTAGPRPLLARHVYTVSGEIIESEARTFIEKRITFAGRD